MATYSIKQMTQDLASFNATVLGNGYTSVSSDIVLNLKALSFLTYKAGSRLSKPNKRLFGVLEVIKSELIAKLSSVSNVATLESYIEVINNDSQVDKYNNIILFNEILEVIQNRISELNALVSNEDKTILAIQNSTIGNVVSMVDKFVANGSLNVSKLGNMIMKFSWNKEQREKLALIAQKLDNANSRELTKISVWISMIA